MKPTTFAAAAFATILATGGALFAAPALFAQGAPALPGDLVYVPIDADRGEFWARLRDIKSFALRSAFGNVEQDDVAKFFDRGEMGERAADLACADKGDFGSCHGFGLRVLGCVRGCDCILSYAKPVRPKRQPRCAAARSWAGPGLAIALTGFHEPWGRRWPHRFGIARHHGGFARQGEEAWKALAFGRLPSWLQLWSA